MPCLPMPASSPDEDPHALRDLLRANGYLFFPKLLPVSRVELLRREVRAALAAADWLADPDSGSLVPRCGARHGAVGWWRMYERIQALERFHALAHAPALVNVARAIIGDKVLNHPRRQLTMLSQRFWIPPHQEHLHVQGTPDTLTAWAPLTAIGADEGLHALAESGPRRLRRVERDRHQGVGIPTVDSEDTWFASPDGFRPGDVVITHSLTVHRTTPNRADALQLSAEFRYQPVWEPVTLGSLLPQHYPRLPGWRALTKSWSTRRWIRTPLVKHVIDYTMPASLEEWHTLLPRPRSTLVDVADG